MIELEALELHNVKRHIILEPTSCSIPTDRKFILYGDKGTGKTALIMALAGLHRPSSGAIARYCKLSFPLGHAGAFRNDLNITENINFVSKIFGAEPGMIIEYFTSFPGLNVSLNADFANLPQSIKTQISFVIAYALSFDCFLIDGPVAIGGPTFRTACMEAFAQRCRTGYIMSTRHYHHAEAYGDCGAVLRDGKMTMFDNIDELVREARAAKAASRDI